MYVLKLHFCVVSLWDQQKDPVLAWLFSLSMEASQPQFQHEQFSEQLLAGKPAAKKCLCGMGELRLMADFRQG